MILVMHLDFHVNWQGIAVLNLGRQVVELKGSKTHDLGFGGKFTQLPIKKGEPR